MPNTHIFTVNPTTFNVHLNYMFAGTGAGITSKDSQAHQPGALADILGVRVGDNIIFYVTECGFYGFFKVKNKGNIVFYENHQGQYLDEELEGKTLTYRLLIEASEYGVYEKGVPEWDAIENPKYIESSSIFKMQWSWIFKKLKGNRGCTAITNDEFELLKRIIVHNNKKLPVFHNYKFKDRKISICRERLEYKGNKDILPRSEVELRTINLEEDLRIFFTARVGIESILNEVLRPQDYGRVISIFNETICSFGEKKIDLMFFTEKKECLLIELKNDFSCDEKIINQIMGYARWVSSYKRDLRKIIPILIIREATEIAPSRGCKYFKYLTKNDLENNHPSEWYQDVIKNIQEAKISKEKYKIKKMYKLKIYSFNTNQDNIIQGFNEL